MWALGTRRVSWGCLLLVAECILVKNGSEGSGQSWARRFYWVRGLWFEAGFQWGIHTYLLIIMEGLIVLKVSRQPCQSLCCHIRHRSQSNQKENKASLSGGRKGRSHKSTGPINPAERQRNWLNAPWTSFLLCWSLEARSNLTKGKGKEELKPGFKKGQSWGRGSKLARANIYVFILYICLIKGWKR